MVRGSMCLQTTGCASLIVLRRARTNRRDVCSASNSCRAVGLHLISHDAAQQPAAADGGRGGMVRESMCLQTPGCVSLIVLRGARTKRGDVCSVSNSCRGVGLHLISHDAAKHPAAADGGGGGGWGAATLSVRPPRLSGSVG